MAEVEAAAPLLVDQLLAMGFEVLTIRRGTLNVTTADGSWETISDIQADVTGRRKGQVGGPRQLHGSRPARRIRHHGDTGCGQGARRVGRPSSASRAICWRRAWMGISTSPRACSCPARPRSPRPTCAASARWFGMPVASADGLNAASVKGQINWARRTIAIEDAKVALDGNEAAGALAAQPRRRAPADRRHARLQRSRPDALRGSGPLAVVPVRPALGIVVGLRSVVPADPAFRCRPAHLRAQGRGQGLSVSAAAPPPSRCARASFSPTSPSSSCTRARSAPRSPPTPTRSCRATRCAGSSRASMRAAPARPCSAPA